MVTHIPKIGIAPAAEPPPPLTIRTNVTPDDFAAAELAALRELLAKRRRRILTVILPLVWFATLLIAVAIWKEEVGKSADLARFWRDLGRLPLWPIVIFLAGMTAIAGLGYATQPWRMRRRALRALRDIGIRGPIPITYRFEATGVTASEPDRGWFVPSTWIKDVLEDEARLIYLLGYNGAPISVPKRGLQAADLVHIRRFAPFVNAAGPAGAPPRPPADLPIQLSYEVTAKDQTAALMWQQAQPATRRLMLKYAVIIFVLLCLVAPVLPALIWIVDPYRVPLADAFPLYAEMLPAWLWKNAVVAAAFLAVVMLITRWGGNARAARDQGRKLQALGQLDPVHVAIGHSGIDATQGYTTNHYHWSSMKDVARMPEHIFLPLRRNARVIGLPLRAFDETSLAQFDALVARHIPGDGKATT